MTNIAKEIPNKPTILHEFNAQPVTAPLVSGRLPIWRLKLWREMPAKFQSAASRVWKTPSQWRRGMLLHSAFVRGFLWFPPGYRFFSVEFWQGKELPIFRPQSKALNLVRKRWSTSPFQHKMGHNFKIGQQHQQLCNFYLQWPKGPRYWRPKVYLHGISI